MTTGEPREPFFLLWCRVCDPDLKLDPLPFGSHEERGKWAAAHTRGTGHDLWLVKEYKPGVGWTPQPPATET